MRRENLAGQRFGFWSVLELAPSVKSETMWLCRCECGEERHVYTKALKRGMSLSCGHDVDDHGDSEKRQSAARGNALLNSFSFAIWSVKCFPSGSAAFLRRQEYRPARYCCGRAAEVSYAQTVRHRARNNKEASERLVGQWGTRAGGSRRSHQPPATFFCVGAGLVGHSSVFAAFSLLTTDPTKPNSQAATTAM